MDLKKIREEIDVRDSQIVKLLNERMELALLSKRFKVAVEDTGREKEVFDNIKNNATGLIDAEFCANLYTQIIAESKKLQQREYSLIGFAGEHGAYAEIASRVWDDSLIAIPTPDFASVFDGVLSGNFDMGIVPIENTLGGVVDDTNALLISRDVKVVGAVDLPVHHCLMVLPGTDHRDIRAVYSHPQALAQCRNFIQRNHLEPVEYGNTASAAKMLAEKKPTATAVIASRTSAELFGLEIVKEGIEDAENNRTRFLVIAKEAFKGEGNKCSILFTTEHKAGTLFKVLETFASEKINLTRIESVPGNVGSYVFFLDFVGSLSDAKIKKILEKMPELTGDFRMLGCYNEKVEKI